MAFLAAQNRGAQLIDIIGWSDDRIDFSLTPLIGLQFAQTPLRLWTKTLETHLLNQFHPQIELRGPRTLSVLTLSPKIGLKSSGLRWELQWSGGGPKVSQSNSVAHLGSICVSEGAAYVSLER